MGREVSQLESQSSDAGMLPQQLAFAPGHNPSRSGRRLIGQMLVTEGLITSRQLNQALALQAGNGGRIVNQLIALGHLTSHSFISFVARQPGMTSIDLTHYRISEELAALIPRDFAYERQVCPIDKLGHLLTVGMVCPLDETTIADLRHITGLSVKPMLCTAESLINAIHRCYSDDGPFTPSRLNRYGLRSLQWIR